MNAKHILDELLNSGKELVEQGKSLAEAKLDLPEDPEQRKMLLDGASKGAIAAGALAILLGTKTGRKLTSNSLKLGSLAALGTVAYKAFENWNADQSTRQKSAGQINAELSESDQEQRSRVLLKAMIAAANVDGHMDEKEKEIIAQYSEKLSLDASVADFIRNELTKTPNVSEIAATADSRELAVEIYLVSRITMDIDNPQEQLYLNQLAQEMRIEADLQKQLDIQATQDR